MRQQITEMPLGQSLSSPSRVLVVDDDEDSRDALQGLLELDGYDVRSAPGGAAALKVAPVFAPDIVILDIHMPGIDGYTVCRLMRRMDQLKATRIFALTALDTDQHVQNCSAAGFDERITKPLQPDTLSQLLRRTSH
jgi:two-component system alkaline phosphatase synthesis response regulator PhoP